MKANELRLGNIVTVNNPIHWSSLKNIPLIVTGINPSMDEFDSSINLAHIDYKTNREHWQTYSQFNQYIEPITITEEWLIKLGFEEEYRSLFTIKFTHFKSQFGYDWSKMNGWHFRYYGQYIECKYVHCLQNLFYALMGTELTIK